MGGPGRQPPSDIRELIKYIQPRLHQLQTAELQDEELRRFIQTQQLDTTVKNLRKRLSALIGRHRISPRSTIDDIFLRKAEEVLTHSYLVKLGFLEELVEGLDDAANSGEQHNGSGEDDEDSGDPSPKAKAPMGRLAVNAAIPARGPPGGITASSAIGHQSDAGIGTTLSKKQHLPDETDLVVLDSESSDTQDDAADGDYEDRPKPHRKRKLPVPSSTRAAGTVAAKRGPPQPSETQPCQPSRSITDSGVGVSTKRPRDASHEMGPSERLKRLKTNAEAEFEATGSQRDGMAELSAEMSTSAGAAQLRKRPHSDLMEPQKSDPRKRVRLADVGETEDLTSHAPVSMTETQLHAAQAITVDHFEGTSLREQGSTASHTHNQTPKQSAEAEATCAGTAIETGDKMTGNAAQRSDSAHNARQHGKIVDAADVPAAPAPAPSRVAEPVSPSREASPRLFTHERYIELCDFGEQLGKDMQQLYQDARMLVDRYRKDMKLEDTVPADLCFMDNIRLTGQHAKLAALYEQILGPHWRRKWLELKGQFRADKWPYPWYVMLESLIAAAVLEHGFQDKETGWNLAENVRKLLGNNLDSGEVIYDKKTKTSMISALNIATYRLYDSTEMRKHAAETAKDRAVAVAGILQPHLDLCSIASGRAAGLQLPLLEKMLEKALLLKGKIDAYDKDYGTIEFIWPGVGDQFDGRTMDCGSAGFVKYEKVHMAIWPGVKVVRKRRQPAEQVIFPAQVNAMR